jgi:hypothetical protein
MEGLVVLAGETGDFCELWPFLNGGGEKTEG